MLPNSQTLTNFTFAVRFMKYCCEKNNFLLNRIFFFSLKLGECLDGYSKSYVYIVYNVRREGEQFNKLFPLSSVLVEEYLTLYMGQVSLRLAGTETVQYLR